VRREGEAVLWRLRGVSTGESAQRVWLVERDPFHPDRVITRV